MLQSHIVNHYANAIAQEAIAAHATVEAALETIAGEAVTLWAQLQMVTSGGMYRRGAVAQMPLNLKADSRAVEGAGDAQDYIALLMDLHAIPKIDLPPAFMPKPEAFSAIFDHNKALIQAKSDRTISSIIGQRAS